MKWEDCLPYAEFSYNNSFQTSLGMAPFEALYGRKCRTLINWSGGGERQLFGPDIIQYAEEKVRIIRDNLKIAQSRQKSTMIVSTGTWSMQLVIKLTSVSLP